MAVSHEGVFVFIGVFCTGLAVYVMLMAICNRRLNQMKEWIERTRGGRQPRLPTEESNQDDDIWNISSRVNQQSQSSGTQGTNWPTHDHHISLQDFGLAPEYTTKDNRPPPPPYSEVDLPSYEQATGCPIPKPDLAPVHCNAENRNAPGPSR